MVELHCFADCHLCQLLASPHQSGATDKLVFYREPFGVSILALGVGTGKCRGLSQAKFPAKVKAKASVNGYDVRYATANDPSNRKQTCAKPAKVLARASS